MAFFISYLASGASFREAVSLLLYGSGLIFMYQASLFYHALTAKKAKAIFRRLDHIAIYWLIAGTYAPCALLFLPDAVGLPLFFSIYGMAILGTLFKVFFMGRLKIISVIVYLLMGWSIIFAIKPMLETFPENLLFWIILGGAFYSVGVVFYAWRSLPWQHPIWHLFVLGGTAAHLIGVVTELNL